MIVNSEQARIWNNGGQGTGESKNPWKTSVKIGNNLTWYLPNTSQACYCHTVQPGSCTGSVKFILVQFDCHILSILWFHEDSILNSGGIH